MKILLPWLEPYLAKLNRYIESGRLPNALLILSDSVSGLHLINHFANKLYCSQSLQGQACGECGPCKMFNAGSYPDFFILQPEQDTKTIKIDAIRKMSQSLALASQFNAPRIVIISPAQVMTLQAANALLKTLEEPADNTTLILLADKPSSVPATIRSRCQQISIDKVNFSIAKQWLSDQGCEEADTYMALANNEPLLAKQMWQEEALVVRNEFFEHFSKLFSGKISPVDFAAKCMQQKTQPLVTWLLSWLTDTIKVSQKVDKKHLSNTDLYPHLQDLAGQLNLVKLYGLLDQLNTQLQLQSGQVNQQLLFESFAVDCYSQSKR